MDDSNIDTISKDDSIHPSYSEAVKGRRKILTPSEKLHKRLAREFVSKKYIGDIILDDSEYEILIEEFKKKYHCLISSYSHKINDIGFAVALVRIGIKYYDGKYWTHVAQVLEVDVLPTNQQTWIGNSFIDTLKKFQKISLSAHEKVNNILMHGFVSDFYANNYFDFLFEYYRLDLDRDIERNDSENLNILIEAMIKNDNTHRTYLLVQQTSDAIANNLRGSKIRLRRFLRLIDKCFWDKDTEINGKNRLTLLFNKWRQTSKNLETEYKKCFTGNYLKNGKKNFSSPYLTCDIKVPCFRLMLPSQLVKIGTENTNLYWHIMLGEKEIIERVSYYEVVTGYKTDKAYIEINETELFKPMTVQLMNGSNRLRSFKDIASDFVRFFDADGDFLRPEALPSGQVCAFSARNSKLQSPAFIYSELCGALLLTYFDCQTGDIIQLPDGNIISIGNKVEEKLSQRGLIKGAYAFYEEKQIPIYNSAPSVIVKMPLERVNGTLIIVNNRTYRMSDIQYLEIPLNDRSGERGYHISLDGLDCDNNGIYSVIIDVPNDRSDRYWIFALINGMKYEFEDSPYIFKSKGTISFDKNLKIFPKGTMEKNTDENSFNFSIVPNETHLCFAVSTSNIDIELFIEIQVLHWKFDNDDWEIEKPNEIWHSKFPTKISFKYPDDIIELCMNEELDYESEEPHACRFLKSKTTGQFECDVTRFKSWFNNEQTVCTVFLKILGKRIPFVDVVVKSRLVSCLITGDFLNNILHGDFHIIGQASYFADIDVNGIKLADKQPVVGGKISVQTELVSGKYKVSVFELEDDDTGFGASEFCLLGEYNRELINPYNLQGKTVEIRHIVKGEKKQFVLSLNCKYFVADLVFKKAASQLYRGTFVVEGEFNKILSIFPVSIEFQDINKLRLAYIEFFDDGEPTCFLYDNQRKFIVKNEDRGLPRSVRYRRYEDLYSGGYLFAVEFIDNYKLLNVAEKSDRENSNLISSHGIASMTTSPNTWQQHKKADILIEDMYLSHKTYNILKAAGVRSLQQILNMGQKRLLEIRNIDKVSIDEITAKVAAFSCAGKNNCNDKAPVIQRLKHDFNAESQAHKGNNVIEISPKSIIELVSEMIPASMDEIKKEPSPSVMDKKIADTGLPPLVFNCLQKAGIDDLRKLNSIVQTKGLKGINNINNLNARMREQVVAMLREHGIV